MSKTNWKNYEKKAAEYFGGERISTSNLGEESPDFESYILIGECKTRKTIPEWLLSMLEQIEKHVSAYKKVPIVILHKDNSRIENDLVILRASFMKQLINELQTTDRALENKIAEIKSIIER